MEKIFENNGNEWSGMRAAEKWLRENGFAVGLIQRDAPRLIAKGDSPPFKYRDYHQDEIEAFDGQMTCGAGGFRGGTVTVTLKNPIQ